MIAAITTDPLDLDRHVTAVSASRFGAVATFSGVVRDHDPSVTGVVTGLEYTAHPGALAALEAIVKELSGDVTIAATHRIGPLAVGDAALVVAVAAEHRHQALDACGEVVERIKAEVPIWKRELLADGSHVWVGLT